MTGAVQIPAIPINSKTDRNTKSVMDKVAKFRIQNDVLNSMIDTELYPKGGDEMR